MKNKSSVQNAHFTPASGALENIAKIRLRDIEIFRAVLSGEPKVEIAKRFSIQESRVSQLGAKIALLVYFRAQDKSKHPVKPPSLAAMKESPTYWLDTLFVNLVDIQDTNPTRKGSSATPFNMLPDCRT